MSRRSEIQSASAGPVRQLLQVGIGTTHLILFDLHVGRQRAC